MAATTATSSRPLQYAARGTAVLVFSQACFFILGYLTVVLLARELGPQLYGTYGVILSVLLWMEVAGRRPISFASAKLLAESTEGQEELEKSSLALNVGLYFILFVLLWAAAPRLEWWFGIDNGTFLFRLAAIDLPLYGVYTALEAIHQGHHRFSRVAISRITYAVSKLVGVVTIIYLGISVEKALLANAFATLGGIIFLLSRIRLQGKERWLARMSPIISMAVPIGFYSFSLPILSWLNLWMLQVMSSPAQVATIGVFVAALNIARVPGLTLSTVVTVLLPSVSRATARNDMALAGRYINQALRFFIILYLPACLVLMARPEQLMQWIYSAKFSGGGSLLSILIVGSGLSILVTILAAILIAAGRVKVTAVISSLSLIPSLFVVGIFVKLWGAWGAAWSAVIIPLFVIPLFYLIIVQHFGTFLNKRSMFNIGLSGTLMFLVDVLLPHGQGVFVLLHIVSLTAYVVSLIILGEIGPKDFALFMPWKISSDRPQVS